MSTLSSGERLKNSMSGVSRVDVFFHSSSLVHTKRNVPQQQENRFEQTLTRKGNLFD